MKRFNLHILLTVLVFAFIGFGCKEDEPEQKKTVKKTTLIYAVNGNNLFTNLETNMSQIESAMRRLPAGEYSMVVYQTETPSTTSLSRIVSGQNATFETIREFDRNQFATDPERLESIISEFMKIDTTAEERNLVLWGHGMAWTPFFSDHKTTKSVGAPAPDGSKDQPELHAFGGDDNQRDWMDIHEMAAALPSGAFNLIIFDCCYMSNIETLYQLRNKAKWVIAYPTEIASYGLPYDQVVPFIYKENADYIGAAQAIYNFYVDAKIAVTSAVINMEEMGNMANTVKGIFEEGMELPVTGGLLNYSRTASCPYYDFGQVVRETATLNGKASQIENFEKALGRMVVYSAASEKDFNGRPIPKENFSGISTHLFKDSGSAEEEYYKTLDWYKAVY